MKHNPELKAESIVDLDRPGGQKNDSKCFFCSMYFMLKDQTSQVQRNLCNNPPLNLGIMEINLFW